MMKGIYSIELGPYASRNYLILSCGMSRAELLERFSLSGSLWVECDLTLGLIRSRVEYRDSLKKLMDDRDYPTIGKKGLMGEICYDVDKDLYMMNIIGEGYDGFSEDERHQFYLTVAHECLHVCQHFLPKYLDRDSEVEAEAYFHTYLMNEVINCFRYNKFY